MKHLIITLIAFFGIVSTQAHAQEAFDHQVWNELLQEHIVVLDGGQATQVNYQGFADEHDTLKSYLDSLATINQTQFDSWPKNDQLAFLINAYNAWTVEFILTSWPDIDSIKELGSLFSSPWSKEIVTLLGQTRSLDDVEHNLIRGSNRYNDPRIHFAVNCASIGCPALANQAYQGSNVDDLLEAQTKLFLNDRSRNRINGKKLEVSSIFKWYAEDFEKGWLGYLSLEEFFIHYADELDLSADNISKLESKKLKFKYLDYDWDLNKTR